MNALVSILASFFALLLEVLLAVLAVLLMAVGIILSLVDWARKQIKHKFKKKQDE